MYANLRIIPLGKDYYRFKADGCKLDRFAIWNEGEQPKFYFDIKSDGNNSYSKALHIKNINGINFHVYDGPEEKDFRGEIFLPVQQNNNYNHSSNSNSHSNSSTNSEKKTNKNNYNDNNEQRYYQIERYQRLYAQFQRNMQEMEEDFNSKIEEINKKHELEKKENEEKKRQLEEEIKRKEEEEKRKIEEHIEM